MFYYSVKRKFKKQKVALKFKFNKKETTGGVETKQEKFKLEKFKINDSCGTGKA